uniref:C-type lectin domain-containing protein n=1 Tax=Salvator merianae TaxID=96440 RepID=A0A8D0C2R4_SALMN
CYTVFERRICFTSCMKTGGVNIKIICLSLGFCSDGWTPFKQSCYKISKESKTWSAAQQNCGLFASGAHLVDIRSEEEHRFLTAYLQSFSQVIMFWTGLNDIKVSALYFS